MGCALSLCRHDVDNEQTFVRQGFALYRAHQYRAAGVAFQMAINIIECIEASIGQYLVLYRSGDIDNALAILALTDSDNKLVKFYFAFNIQNEDEDEDEASQIYNEILATDLPFAEETLNDKIAIALTLDAMASLRHDNVLYRNAIEYYDIILENEDTPAYWKPQIFLYKAQTFQKMEFYQRSSAAALDAYKADPSYIDALIHSAKMLEIMDDTSSVKVAMQKLDIAAAVNKQDVDALQTKSEMAYREQMYDVSIATCDRIIAIYSDFAEPYYRKGCCLVKTKQYQEALVCYNKAISYDDQNIIYYLNRGAAHVMLDHQKEACQDFYTAYKLDEDSSALLGEVLELVEYNIKSFGGKISERFMPLQIDRKDLILQVVEEIDTRTVLFPQMLDSLGRIQGFTILLKREQMSVIDSMMEHHNKIVAELHAPQKAYYDTFVKTLNDIYAEYQALYYQPTNIDKIEGAAEHEVGSILSFMSKIFGAHCKIETHREHAANLMNIAPDQEVFGCIAQHIALKVTIDNNALWHPASIQNIIPRIMKHVHLSSENMLSEAYVAHHDACNLAFEMSNGKMLGCSGKTIIDMAYQLVVHHPVYEVSEPITDVCVAITGDNESEI